MESRWLWTVLIFCATLVHIQGSPDVKNVKVKRTESERNTEDEESEHNKPHSRQKRLIWVTDDGRLALPPGTSLTIAPTLALPFIRYPPDGFFSNLTISLPLTIDFDKLGLTDNQNPLGVIPPIFARSMGRAAGSILANYISSYLHSRKKRAIFEENQNNRQDLPFTITKQPLEEENDPEEPLKLPDNHKHAFHGGERALLYAVVEDMLATFGLDGKACLLRAICEIHSKEVRHFGLLGEMVKLFFTASRSPFSDLLDEYVTAERIGQGDEGPGECFPYFKKCPKSLFQLKKNKYKEEDIVTKYSKNHDLNSNNVAM